MQDAKYTLMGSNKRILIAGLIGGCCLALLVSYILEMFQSHTKADNSLVEKAQPLYWVAPMDDNYRRDQPGKSPMGMDLVPVYDTNDDKNSAGVVTISPSVVQNLGVRTARVNARMFEQSIETVGYVQYDQDTLVHIHPRVEGWIETLFVKAEGDPVVKGQALYSLYSPQLVNAQEEFLIALKRKNANLINAAKERLAALQLSGRFIQDLEEQQKIQQTVTFYAPQTGVVDGLKIREGFFVEPGNTLMSIGQLQQVWLEAQVFESDIHLVEEGLSVTMTLDYLPTRQWLGTVDYVYPTLSPDTRTMRIRVKFNNSDLALKPNMFARAVIQSTDNASALMVPKDAIIRTGHHNRVVLAMGKGQFKSVEVKVGRMNGQFIEVIDGLFLGDEVVISAQFLIDSESSKTSDFLRLSEYQRNEQDTQTAAAKNSQEVVDNSATVNGVIDHIDEINRRIVIQRDAIEKWQRPAATIDFALASDIDVSTLNTNMSVRFTFVVGDDFVVTDIQSVNHKMRGNTND